MLNARIFASLFMGAVALLSIFILPNIFLTVLICIFIFLGLKEFYAMVEEKGIYIYKYFGTCVGLLIPISIYFGFENIKGLELALIIAVCLCLFILQFMRRENTHAVIGISVTLFGIFYVSWLFSFMLKIKLIDNPFLPAGKYIIFYLIMVTKTGDIFAYLIGSKFGRHSLIPRISPKKSVEGSVSALIASMCFSALFWLFFRSIAIYHFVILGLLLGVLSQIGDLSESLIKRDCNVKDSGSFMPGLGGMLDIIDSLLFTAPVLYFYIKMFLET